MRPTFAHDTAGTPAASWRDHPRWSALPVIDVADAATERLVVVAAHPDDESLGAAGLIASASRAGIEVVLVLVTAGEHSHPRSPTTTPDELAGRRRAESAAALAVLAPGASTVQLEIADGAVAPAQDILTERLVGLVGDGRGSLLVAPWRHDGHPDHEATGRAAAAATLRTGSRLLEYPVWFWHWADPDDAPWEDLRVVRLDTAAIELKRQAVAAHASQVAALSDRVGDEVLLHPSFLAHFADASEIFVRQPAFDGALEELHREREDPWQVDSSWYEQRKRDLTLALLPRRRFARGLELGCSTGALAESLAGRCDDLMAVDASPSAAARARVRLATRPNVTVHVLDLPDEWPDGSFDLVVVSELGYFLSPVALERLLDRVAGCVARDGVIVLCHWRHEVVGWPLDGPAVHHVARERLDRPVAARYRDRDVEILVLCRDDLMPEPTR